MKLSKFFFHLFVLFAMVGTIGIIAFFHGRKEIDNLHSQEQLLVCINNISQTAKEHWTDTPDVFSQSMEVVHKQENYVDFRILNKGNESIYTTNSEVPGSYQKAVEQDALIYPLLIEEQTEGYIILHPTTSNTYLQLWEKLFWLFCSLLLVLLMVGVSYYIYLYCYVLRPFQKLRDFARSIASGDLERPLPMDRKNVFGAFSESFDLMREELKRARENEFKASQSKKELMVQLNHDIKSPIASIKSISELMLALEKKKEHTDYLRKLENINNKADQIDLLVSNMLSATLEELDELQIHNDMLYTTDLSAMLEQADYRHAIQSCQLEDCMIFADPLRLPQIFNNIIGNSYKYANTPIEITGELTNFALPQNQGQTFYCLTLRDFGNNQEFDNISLLTNKFYRGTNTKNIQGTGLGLYISKQLMEKMQGHLIVSGDAGGFIVKLLFSLQPLGIKK